MSQITTQTLRQQIRARPGMWIGLIRGDLRPGFIDVFLSVLDYLEMISSCKIQIKVEQLVLEMSAKPDSKSGKITVDVARIINSSIGDNIDPDAETAKIGRELRPMLTLSHLCVIECVAHGRCHTWAINSDESILYSESSVASRAHDYFRIRAWPNALFVGDINSLSRDDVLAAIRKWKSLRLRPIVPYASDRVHEIVAAIKAIRIDVKVENSKAGTAG
jgi:hypothetical protein